MRDPSYESASGASSDVGLQQASVTAAQLQQPGHAAGTLVKTKGAAWGVAFPSKDSVWWQHGKVSFAQIPFSLSTSSLCDVLF
jgi:hypothetical protein